MRAADEIINREARTDWVAACVAGLSAGAVVWLLSHGLPWFTSGLISPTVMGRDLKPPGLVDAYRSNISLLLQAGLSIGYALIIAPLVTHLRRLWALAMGGVIGLALYALNYCVFHFLVTPDWTGTELPVLVTHLVFGLIAAGVYKGLAAHPSIDISRQR